MGNSTTFLTLPAHQLLGTQIVYAEKYVDTTLENVASAGTIDVLNLPKGCIPMIAGYVANTHQDTLTWELDIYVSGSKVADVLAATNLDTDNKVIMSCAGADSDEGGFVSTLLADDGTLRAVAGAATASTFKGTFFCVYAVSDAAR